MWHSLTAIEKLIWLKHLSGGGSAAVLLTYTGALPASLTAVAKAIKTLTQYGKIVQATTPTPSAPVYPVCNNGALKAVDDELPSGYKRVLGFACDNNAMWQITGFKLKGSDTVRISFSINAACNVFGCYQGADATDNYDLYASTTSGSKYFRYANGTYLSYWSSANLGQRFDVVYTPTGSSGMPQDSTWTEKTFTSANDLLIGSTTTTGTSAKLKGNLYGTFVVDGRLKLIPCERVSDGMLGYYDTYSETFYEPSTGFTGAVSLGYDGSHYVLATVGTDEVLTVAPGASSTQATTPTPESPSAIANTKLGNTVLRKVGTYADSYDPSTNTITRRVGVKVLDGTETVQTSNACFTIAISEKVTSKTELICSHFPYSNKTSSQTADETIISFSSTNIGFRYDACESKDDFKTWLSGHNVTVYYPLATETTEAYTGSHVGGAAAVEDLLAVGDYNDEQEVIGGTVERNCGAIVLNGTENSWALSDSGTTHRFRGTKPSDCYTPSGRAPIVSSHFVYVATGQATGGAFVGASSYWYFIPSDQTIDTADKWTAWLAENPVVVIYPLATATTEQVTAQPLHTVKGATAVDAITDVAPVSVEIEYYGPAEA